VAGLRFDEDDGNRQKRQKHGLSIELEFVPSRSLIVPSRMGSELLDAAKREGIPC
jgi:hypothetical protein